MRMLIAFAASIAFVSGLHAELQLTDVQSSFGQLGPARESSEYVLGDEVYFRFNVVGARIDVDGRTQGELTLVARDAAGKKVVESAYPMQQVPCLGGDRVAARAVLTLGDPLTPGKYTLEVGYTDLIAKKTASFKREFTCKPTEFAIAGLRFYQDKEGRVPAPVGGMLSQTLFIQARAIGFDKSNDEIDVEMRIEVLDEKGKVLTPKPIKVVLHSEKPEEVREAKVLNFSAELALHRPGDFRLRITLSDLQSKKSVKFEAPMKVIAP
jgi:hypothetical protein